MNVTDLPTVVFKCKADYDSFKFEDRVITLDPNGAPVKIGRSQGPLKPKSDNSIFECRVLSRHHAHIWYEDEQIWVKDKGSSNGTFVNGMKVTGEQVSIKTGDILQFGVDVDNNPRTTYWCVIAQVLCNQQNYEFTEADWEPLSRYVKACSQSSNNVSMNRAPRLIQNQSNNENEHIDEVDKVHSQVFQSAIMDAISMQQNVEGKMVTMQRIIHDIDVMQKEQWNEALNNDILLTKIENLERKLTCHNLSDSTVAFRRLLDEKSDLEMTSKMTLRKSLQEKLEIQNKYDNLKKCLNQSEEDNEKLNQKLSKADEIITILKSEEKQLKNETDTKDKEIQILKNELQQADYRIAQEKEKSNLNINSCLNYIKKEANRLEERHLEMLRTLAAENMEHDSTKEFILEEAKLKNEAMSKTILTMQDKIDLDCNEITNLEKLIKSQASELAGFFDSMPTELSLNRLDQVTLFVRNSDENNRRLENEMNTLKAEIKEVRSKRDEYQLAKERLELLANKNKENKSPDPETPSVKPIKEKNQSPVEIFLSDGKIQLIVCLLILLVAMAITLVMR